MRPDTVTRRPLTWRVRSIALLLLVLQGLVATSPLFEPRNEGDIPRLHVEGKDAPHLNLHHEGTCALCSARTILATPPVPVCPLIELGPRQRVVSSVVGLALSADPRIGNLSRAPPSLPG